MSNAALDALKAAKSAQEAAKEQAKAKARAATKAQGVPTSVTGPLGLPSNVKIAGVRVPSIIVIGAAGVVLLLVAGLIVHAVRGRE